VETRGRRGKQREKQGKGIVGGGGQSERKVKKKGERNVRDDGR
jgi:hypothetical protein